MNRTPNNNDFTYNIDGDSIEGGIEGILKAFFPNMVSRAESKSTDRPKIVRFGFDEYRIKYFTKKQQDTKPCFKQGSNPIVFCHSHHRKQTQNLVSSRDPIRLCFVIAITQNKHKTITEAAQMQQNCQKCTTEYTNLQKQILV